MVLAPYTSSRPRQPVGREASRQPNAARDYRCLAAVVQGSSTPARGGRHHDENAVTSLWIVDPWTRDSMGRLHEDHGDALMREAGAIVIAAIVLALQTTLPAPKNWTAAEDHQQMMDQLGIKTLRPGPSGSEQAPNHANYDEATAN